jgi:3-hydroxyisobutyrate dehydrogenase-like beta-hydroxyacid dehydrogenase
MSPIGPKRIASPILLGGPHAAAFARFAQPIGFTGTDVFALEIGRASAAKMSRSVFVKGMEALLAESLLTARKHGVEQTVLASLEQLLPGADWRRLARYMISRSLLHGRRRAEEMREVARTVANAGIAPHMSAACAERQDWAAQFSDCAELEGLEEMLDAMLSRMSDAAPGSIAMSPGRAAQVSEAAGKHSC